MAKKTIGLVVYLLLLVPVTECMKKKKADPYKVEINSVADGDRFVAEHRNHFRQVRGKRLDSGEGEVDFVRGQLNKAPAKPIPAIPIEKNS